MKIEAELATTGEKDVVEVHFLVASRQLRIVFGSFNKMFASGFAARLQSIFLMADTTLKRLNFIQLP
jgi:hypothetical protein